jgi:hypothetical protein
MKRPAARVTASASPELAWRSGCSCSAAFLKAALTASSSTSAAVDGGLVAVRFGLLRFGWLNQV